MPSVHIDDEAGGRLATEHLLELGTTRIAFVGDTEANAYGFDSSARRRAGYEAALRDAGRSTWTGARPYRAARP